MFLRYHELVGKRVVGADGTPLGRVTDLVAAADGEALCVVALLVGPAGLIRRIGSRGMARAPERVPWGDVARVADAIHLRVDDSASAASADRSADR